jgi:PAS domain S-box-containing protein
VSTRVWTGSGYDVLDAMADPVLVMSAVRDGGEGGEIVDLRFEYVNAAASRTMALASDALIGRGLLEFFPDHRRAGLFDAYCSVIGTDSPKRVDVPASADTAAPVVWEVTLSPFADGFIATMLDVTQRRQAVEEVELREARLQMLLEHAGDLSWYAIDDELVWYSSSMSALLGWEPGELVGQTVDNYMHPDDLPDHWAYRQRIREVGSGRIRYRARHRDGSFHWIESMARRVADPRHPHSSCVIGISFDVQAEVEAAEQLQAAQERHRHLELELQHRQRLESLGLLASGIAHDLNNMLSGVLIGTDLARSTLAPDSVASGHLDDVLVATGRISALTGQLLDYVRKRPVEAVTLDLADVLDETSTLMRSTWPRGVALRTEIARPLRISADRGRLTQVLLNLMVNAAQACGVGDTVTVTAEQVERWEGVDLHGVAGVVGPSSWVQVRVADTGRGIEPDLLKRIFDPFFTTKPDGQGLGLSVVQGLVETFGGSVEVASTVGSGTTFTLRFPSAQG